MLIIGEKSMNEFEINLDKNSSILGENISINGYVKGIDNIIKIGKSDHPSKINITVNGNNNNIIIKDSVALKGLTIRIGNHTPANNCTLIIDSGFSIEGGGGRFLLDNHNNKLIIGNNCLFSNSITIRCGDSPHLIFNKKTGEYLDHSDGVFIGNHVWIGEKVYITKKTSIPSESIVAACSVVTKRFYEPHVVLAGNPAKEVRKDIQWIRNKKFIQKNSKYDVGFNQYLQEVGAE